MDGSVGVRGCGTWGWRQRTISNRPGQKRTGRAQPEDDEKGGEEDHRGSKSKAVMVQPTARPAIPASPMIPGSAGIVGLGQGDKAAIIQWRASMAQGK